MLTAISVASALAFRTVNRYIQTDESTNTATTRGASPQKNNTLSATNSPFTRIYPKCDVLIRSLCTRLSGEQDPLFCKSSPARRPPRAPLEPPHPRDSVMINHCAAGPLP
ncbi:hypothetical protein EVAR_5007_1 [Eumeta japonica]|uniref:Uncharacterized protein n=1 Tax=Eumeta variegata TaxID=151549 RepID=A0A4C1STU6_EUMVA|nr:hypothetical protein EVAR_5007_1 [Eumeta japonica]